jgi:hypothetical protein
MLVIFAVFPLGGAVTAGIAALLSVVVIVSELQELGLYANLFRVLVPKAESQNVFATIPSSGAHERDIVLVSCPTGTSARIRSTRWIRWCLPTGGR